MTDAQIEQVARRICEELGIDPDETVGCGFGADFTPREWKEYDSHTIPAVALYVPRWRIYRSTAAQAIATKAALDGSGETST